MGQLASRVHGALIGAFPAAGPAVSVAADQGSAGAQYRLGDMDSRGRGGPQDYGEATQWLDKAAGQGFAHAQFDRGVLYEKGHEFEREFGAAPRLRAALHGGPVITGEVGGSRRAIVYHGDVMNTTSRLEQATRDLGRQFLVTGDAMQRLADLEELVRLKVDVILARASSGAMAAKRATTWTRS